MKVIVIGGGIGGLALAAGLRRRGMEVVVHERDTDLSATGGYHITLTGPAQQALRRLLPAGHVEQLLASASAVRLRECDLFTDHRGRAIGRGPSLGRDGAVDIDRITLRLLLADAVGGDLRLGRRFTGWRRSDGRVIAEFADGTTDCADLLVGADGAGSVVARRLAGGPTSRPAGIIGVSGRTVADDLDQRERERLGRRSSTAVGPRGSGLYVGFLDPVGNAVLDRPELNRSISRGATYIWGAMFPETDATLRLREVEPGGLAPTCVEWLQGQGWSPQLLQVIERTQPGTVAVYRFRAATTDPQAMAPWPAGVVTAIGDAVHATPPTAGMGAGVAVQDAADLADALEDVMIGSTALTVAVSDVQQRIRERGADVVALSMRPVRMLLATQGRFGTATARAALPVAAALTRLSRGRLAAGRV